MVEEGKGDYQATQKGSEERQSRTRLKQRKGEHKECMNERREEKDD